MNRDSDAHSTAQFDALSSTELFDVPEGHTLKLASSKTVERNSVMCEIRWLDELDSGCRLVARFRTWTNRSLKPPYRRQRGWEKFSVSGNLLDREVRYSKRDDMSYLH